MGHGTFFALALVTGGTCAPEGGAPEPRPDQPIELGSVAWERDHDAAFARAASTGRPVLVLFQEIPGCQTCQRFGQGPLSHPLLVEAIETEFVPLAVYNNEPGADAQVLARYREPSWNNPVVRFFAPDGDELLPRLDGVWTSEGIAERMVRALDRADREVPAWLALAVAELDRKPLERAVFGMHCFWEGEARLGGLPGVRSTRAGFLGGEVVEVLFDSERIDYAALVRAADARGVASRVLATDEAQLQVAREVVGARASASRREVSSAPASDRKHRLAASPLRYLPLTPLQATRVNAALGSASEVERILSPRQRALAQRVQAALARDPRALDGLERPDDLAALPSYERALLARLE
jgi:hypothetical protein